MPYISEEYTEEELLSRIAERPDDAEVYGDYALFLEEDVARWKEAEPYYRRAVELDGDNAYNHGNYADILRRLRRFKEAQKHYERALALAPDETSILDSYAAYLAELGGNDEVDSIYRKILTLEPDDPSWLNNYGVFLACTGRPKEALPYLKHAAAGDVEGPDLCALFNLASLLKEQGEYAEAAAFYKCIIAIGEETGMDHVALAIAHRDCAEILCERGCFDDAERHYRRSLEMDASAVAHFGYAAVLERLGRAGEAAEEVEGSIGQEF